MTSRNIAVFVTGGTKKLVLDEPFLTGHGTTIQLKQATVFWKFKNITTANNKYKIGSERKALGEGYWDFELLKERLEERKSLLRQTCTIIRVMSKIRIMKP